MAKSKETAGVNKSQEVRDYLKSNPNAGPKEVKTALAGKGITISEGLVSNIKYAKSTESSGKVKKVKKRKASTTRKVSSSKSAGSNKSQAIRDYLKVNPTATAKDVVPALSAQGVEVSEGLVSVIRSSMGKKKKKRKVVKSKGAAAGSASTATRRASSTGGLSAQDLIDAKKFVDGLGGVSAARRALDTLEQLR